MFSCLHDIMSGQRSACRIWMIPKNSYLWRSIFVSSNTSQRAWYWIIHSIIEGQNYTITINWKLATIDSNHIWWSHVMNKTRSSMNFCFSPEYLIKNFENLCIWFTKRDPDHEDKSPFSVRFKICSLVSFWRHLCRIVIHHIIWNKFLWYLIFLKFLIW